MIHHLISSVLCLMMLPILAAAQSPPPTAGAGGPIPMPTGANVAVIRIEGMIYDFTLQSLERRVERALDAGASVIVIELDTPGGVVTSALEISKYIKTLPVPTIAWVNNDAYSAGIIIGSACDRLVMSPASATGDAAPISLFGNLAPTERAKILSPILEEFRDNATSNGYDFTIFHAMAVLGVEVYQIENPSTGEVKLVNQKDYAVMVSGQDIPAASVSSLPDADDAVDPASVGAPTVSVATPGDQGQWRLVRKVHDGKTLLTLNQTRALEVGLSEATIANDADLQQWLGANQVGRVSQTWSENLAGYLYFLTHPLAKGVLMVVLMVGAYIELQSPGFGLGGAVAGVALLLLLGAPLVIGLAEVWHLIAFALGLGLLALEIAFLPGFGLLGVAGLVLMFVGLVFAGIPTGGNGPFNLPPREMWGQVLASTLAMLVGVAVSFVAAYFLSKHFGRIPLFNKLILDAPPQLAGVGGPVIQGVSGDEEIGGGAVRVGETGRAATQLRPAGRADLGGRVVDVVTVGSWIEPGRRIRVIEVHGNRIVVEEEAKSS